MASWRLRQIKVHDVVHTFFILPLFVDALNILIIIDMPTLLQSMLWCRLLVVPRLLH